MRGLLRVFLVASCFWAALLFWWKPSSDVVAIKVVNWAREYKDKVTDPKPGFGVMGMAKSFIRKNSSQLTLDEFINKKIKDRLIKVRSNDLQTWLQARMSDPLFDIERPIYFRLSEPLVPDMPSINFPFGYIEVEGNGLKSYISVNRVQPDDLGGKGIPTALRYSDRTVAVILALIWVLYLIIKKVIPARRDLVAQSTAGTGMRVFMVILTGGAAVVSIPFLYDWMHDFPPFVFTGGFIVIIGLVGLVMFGYQWFFVSRLIGSGDHLVHWTFTPQEWNNFSEKEYKAELVEKRGLLIFLSGIILLVGAIFWLIVHNIAGAIVFLVLLGVIALLTVVAVIVPWLNYRRNIKQDGEIFIGKNGLYLNGAVHTWALLGARLEDAVYLKEPFSCLGLTYSYWVMAGRMLYFYRTSANIRVPVPEGKEVEAQDVIKKLKV